MKKQLLITFACLFTLGFVSESYGSYELMQQNPECWNVVKETPEYVIVEMCQDLDSEVIGKAGTFKVNYKAGERRVFLKGRKYKTSVKSNGSYGVKQKIQGLLEITQLSKP